MGGSGIRRPRRYIRPGGYARLARDRRARLVAITLSTPKFYPFRGHKTSNAALDASRPARPIANVTMRPTLRSRDPTIIEKKKCLTM